MRDSTIMKIAGLLLTLGLVGIVFYASTLSELFSAVLRREDSSHGLFVPLLSLFFVWSKRSKLREIEPKYEIVLGLGVVAGGLLLFLLAKGYAYFSWECFSLLGMLSGLVICFLGKEISKQILFPIFYLIFMIPIPQHLYNTLVGFDREL